MHADLLSLQHEQLYARLASIEREYKEQIEALGRRFDEQDAELQDLRRQVATGPEASGRRLQVKGAKNSKGNGSDSGGGGGGGSLTTRQLSIINALDICMELSSATDELIVQGCDLIVRSNGNETHVDLNTTDGKGNLIVGWNEDDGGDKTGLNIIVGSGHTYNSTGGAVFGRENTISAASATVTGGYGNTASGESASVSGGTINRASSSAASVSGGLYNNAIGEWASVSGGNTNTASGEAASVTGGYGNTASTLNQNFP